MTSPRRYATRVLFAALVTSLVVLSPSPANASEDQAKQKLFAAIKVLKEKYPSLRDRREYGAGTLEEGKSEIYHEHFEAGTTYLVLAVGCNGASDIDIGIGDSNGNVVAADTQDDASPIAIFTPERTGDYLAVVKMSKTNNSDPAHFAYQVFYVETER